MSMANAANNSGNKGWPLHAIQLATLRVLALQLQAKLDVDPATKPKGFTLETAHSEYDSDDSTISVRVRARVGMDGEVTAAPYSLEVELLGVFNVDASKFPVEHIEHWAQNNAPLILYPYVREHAASMAIRAGFEPVLLPLLEMPSFKIAAPENTSTART